MFRGLRCQRCQHLEKKKRDEAPKVPRNEAPRGWGGGVPLPTGGGVWHDLGHSDD